MEREAYLELLEWKAVQAFAGNAGYNQVRTIRKNILDAYDQDFSTHAPNEVVRRIRKLGSSVPSQLAKENRKFVYSHIKEGARAKDYELAMAWLINCGLLHRVNRVKKPVMPLKAYEDLTAFKLYLVDAGLLAVNGRYSYTDIAGRQCVVPGVQRGADRTIHFTATGDA